MSRAFDAFYRTHINDEYRRNLHRLNPTAAVEEKKVAAALRAPKPRRMFVPQKSGRTISESVVILNETGEAAKALTTILVDAKSWLEQYKVKLGNMPPDAPEMSIIQSVLGLANEYLPQPNAENPEVSDKVCLLAQKLEALVANGGTSELTDYIRTLSGKLCEFRANIDVADVAPPEAPAAAPKEAPGAPATPPKPAPQNPNKPDQLAKGLELPGNVK